MFKWFKKLTAPRKTPNEELMEELSRKPNETTEERRERLLVILLPLMLKQGKDINQIAEELVQDPEYVLEVMEKYQITT